MGEWQEREIFQAEIARLVRMRDAAEAERDALAARLVATEQERDAAMKLANFPGWKAEYLAREERRWHEGRAEVAALAAQVEEAKALLVDLEWSHGVSRCPECWGANPQREWPNDPKDTGHTPDCRLAAFLGRKGTGNG